MNKLLRVVGGLACSIPLSIAAGCGGTPASDGTGVQHNALTQITETIPPADVRGIREAPGGEPFLLGFLAVKEGTSDRTVIELELQPIQGKLVSAALNLGIANFDQDNADEGVIDVDTFIGDGTVTADEFSAGTYFTSFTYNGGPGVTSVDLTGAVAERLAAGDRYLGVRLTAATSDRFFLGSLIGEPEPSLTFTTLVFGLLDAIDQATEAVPDVAGAQALLQQLSQARMKSEQAQALFDAGEGARAQLAYCQARKKLDDFIEKANLFVKTGHLSQAQGSELVGLAQQAQQLLDEEMLCRDLAACDARDR